MSSDQRTMGLYEKFRIERNDGKSAPGEKHDGCEYFVLDVTHDKHAHAALLAYADSCEADYPLLARDVRSQAKTQILRGLVPSPAVAPAEPSQQLPPCINGECLYSCADDVCKKADEKGVPWPPKSDAYWSALERAVSLAVAPAEPPQMSADALRRQAARNTAWLGAPYYQSPAEPQTPELTLSIREGARAAGLKAGQRNDQHPDHQVHLAMIDAAVVATLDAVRWHPLKPAAPVSSSARPDRQTEDQEDGAGLICQTIPDVEGTEPRPSMARVVHTMEMDGTITRELFGDIERCYEVLRHIEGGPREPRR